MPSGRKKRDNSNVNNVVEDDLENGFLSEDMNFLSEDLEKLKEDREDLIQDQEMLNEDLDKLSEDQEKLKEDLDLAILDDDEESYIFRGKRQTFDPWDMYEARLIPGISIFSTRKNTPTYLFIIYL